MTTETFVTDAGVTVPAVTTDQMREVDRVAIEEVGPNLYQMMENAGRNLALTVLETLGANWTSTPITVLAGTGGNGGGGICAARHLANRGADVTVAITDPRGLTSVPNEQLEVYRGTPGKLADLAALDTLRPGLVVDAIIGYSLGGAPRGVARRMIEWIGDQPAPVLSLDVPSGIDSTTGSTRRPRAGRGHFDAGSTEDRTGCSDGRRALAGRYRYSARGLSSGRHRRAHRGIRKPLPSGGAACTGLDHTSTTTFVLGLLQQIRTDPGSGGSRGSRTYSTSPSCKPDMQVWHTPDRQL